jgi:hypothetical protein
VETRPKSESEEEKVTVKITNPRKKVEQKGKVCKDSEMRLSWILEKLGQPPTYHKGRPYTHQLQSSRQSLEEQPKRIRSELIIHFRVDCMSNITVELRIKKRETSYLLIQEILMEARKKKFSPAMIIEDN